MRVLADQDVYEKTVQFLRSLGHDVRTAAQEGLSTAPDSEVYRRAQVLGRLLVTRDKGFGLLAQVPPATGGVVLLRVRPETIELVHLQLDQLLRRQVEEHLRTALTTVEQDRYRIRRLA